MRPYDNAEQANQGALDAVGFEFALGEPVYMAAHEH